MTDDHKRRMGQARILASKLSSPSGKLIGDLIIYFMENKISPTDAWTGIAMLIALEEDKDLTFRNRFESLMESARASLREAKDVRSV